MIFFDLDGVLADFNKAASKRLVAAGYPPTTNPYWTESNDDLFWEIIKPNFSFWVNIEPISGGIQLWNTINLKGLTPSILSAYSSKQTAECVSAKRCWLQFHLNLSDPSRINLVKRSQKKDFAKTNGTSNVLIDDFEKNCQEFRNAGGIAVRFENINKTIKVLSQLRII